jgi:hypothetical protein
VPLCCPVRPGPTQQQVCREREHPLVRDRGGRGRAGGEDARPADQVLDLAEHRVVTGAHRIAQPQ